MPRLLALILLLLHCGTAHFEHAAAEEVVVEHLGLELVGNLETAPGKSLEKDGVALIVHGTLAHHRMEIVAALQKELKARGISTLAVTLGLGLDRRQGMYDCKLEHDHRHSDGPDEIGAWVDWLRERKAVRIALIGHSRGGNQVALFAAEPGREGVDRVVLIAPMATRFEKAAEAYRARYGKDLVELLREAQRLVDEGDGENLMPEIDFLSCPKARVTAATFVDYYAPNPKHYTPDLVPAIGLPVLVVAAELDTAVPELAAELPRLKGHAHVETAVIAGADHFFRDLAAEDLADRIKNFLDKSAGTPPRK